MDFSYLKYLLYINTQNKVSKLDLKNKFNLTDKDIKNITTYLKENDYIIYVGDTCFSSLCYSYKILL